jgi:hypothetical protein
LQKVDSSGEEIEISTTDLAPPPSLPISSTLTYQIELQRNGRDTRKAFCKKLSSELRRKGLEQSIQERKDHVLKNLILVELINQEQLPKLREILRSIESQLGTTIELNRW